MAEDVDKDAAEEEKEMAGADGAEGVEEKDEAEPAGGTDAPGTDAPGTETGGTDAAPDDGAPAGEEAAPGTDEASSETGGDEGAEEGAEEDSVVDDDVWAAALKEAEAAGSAGGEGGPEVSDGAESAGNGAGAPAAGGAAAEASAAPPVETKPADFAELRGNSSEALANMDMILDIPVTVSVELGRAEMIIKDILQLGQGSVVELEKLAGEPMEILVNGRLVARGEVVMVEEKFGVRLTDIISPTERVKRLA